MIRHIVGWNYKDGLSEEQKEKNALKIKHDLEELAWNLDGIIEFYVHVEALASSHRGMVLNSIFESEESLRAYQASPEHQAISSYINTVMQDKICLDYEEQ